MALVVIHGDLPGEAEARLRQKHEVVVTKTEQELHGLAKLAQAEGLLCLLTLRVNQQLLARMPSLKVVANFGVGFDNIDVPACTSRKIAVANTPDVLTEGTADLAWALLAATARRIPEGDRYVRSGQWKGYASDLLLGVDMFGKTLGIVGLGRIGRAMARRAEGFSMRIIYSHPRPVVGVPYTHVAFDTLLTESDFVSLHCPLRPETHHLLDAKALAKLRPNAIVVNTARGAVIDEKALIEWVRRGGIAGLDVFEGEPNVPAELVAEGRIVLLPHIGSATAETRRAMAILASQNLLDALSGRRPAALLNPDVWPAFVGPT